MNDVIMDSRPKLIRTESADYLRREKAENNSGYKALGDRVIIVVDESSEQSAGGVFYTQDQVEKMTMASETGIIVDMGDASFYWSFDRTNKWYGRKPNVGDRVYIQRYAGRLLKGNDGCYYRIMDDICIAAIEDKLNPPEVV